ncbi:MAG: 3-hydroxyacyl-ACP dehydratase FabZ [Planctomycetota bacterium]|jgi:beta-hydroxyacyl-ACP dehydratase FabZ
MDIEYIKGILPHRDPFLFVDKILTIEKGVKIEALRKFTSKEPFFKGHFPGNPVVPGVVLVESLAQVGGILVFESFKEDLHDKLPALVGLENVKFKKPVFPDDEVKLTVTLLKSRSRLWKMYGEASIGGSKVAQAEILASVF